MSGGFSANLEDMQKWAEGLMASRPADYNIGKDYMRRWWVIPRNDFCNVYLHDIRESDDDRAFHDHPWANTSLVIAGGYIEHTPEGIFERSAGDVISRPANALHRLEMIPEKRAISLFMTGPKVRDWGFDCGHGWVNWRDFLDARDKGQVGHGCGEYDNLSPVSIVGTYERA